jgi:hypothetical protein
VRRVLFGQGGGPVQQRLAAQARGDVAGLRGEVHEIRLSWPAAGGTLRSA